MIMNDVSINELLLVDKMHTLTIAKCYATLSNVIN